MDKQEWLNMSYTRELLNDLEQAINKTRDQMIVDNINADNMEKASAANLKLSGAIIAYWKVVNSIRDLPTPEEKEEQEVETKASEIPAANYDDVLDAEVK